MSWHLILSLAARMIATGWCLMLVIRFRELRIGVFGVLLAVMTSQAALRLTGSTGSGIGETGTMDLLEVVVSLLALTAVFFLGHFANKEARIETLAAAFRASPDAIVLSSLPSGLILEANEGFRKVIGHRPEDVIGKTPQELNLWADHAERVQMMERLYSLGQVRDLGIHLRHRSGSVLTCQVTAEVVEIAGGTAALSILRDVSDRERAEAALRTSEAMFSKAFSASPDAITVSTLAEGTFIEINESFTQMTGFERNEALGQTSLELGLWTEQAERDHFRETLLVQGNVTNHDVTFRHRSGAFIHCLVSADVIDFSGELNLLMTVRDVTERREGEEERAGLIRELEAKNAELERFAYTLSHDLKSPLVTINGFLGLLEKDVATGASDRVAHDLLRIRGATDTMGQLVDELLELSRVGRVIHPSQECSLSELANSAVEMVAGRMTGRDFQIEIDPELPLVLGDKIRLLEVLQNLLDNAVKFIGSEPQPKIEVGFRTEADETIIFVRDNGSGIDKQYHQKVFELFDRLQSDIDGTGVGLALVKRIVEVHGGRVWVESEGEGLGSTFCFTLADSLRMARSS